MIIGSGAKLKQFHSIDLVIGNDQLGFVSEFKYLGVIINQHLTWHNHTELIQSKVLQRLGILKRLKHLLPIHTRKRYVSTMITPILEYASNVWGEKRNKVLMDSIEVLQNKAAKLILDERSRSSSSEALSKLKWLDLSSRRQLQHCMFMFDVIRDNDKEALVFKIIILERKVLSERIKLKQNGVDKLT